MSENCANYEIMWKNMSQPDRPQMIVRHRRFECCVTKATDTHSEYVTWSASIVWLYVHCLSSWVLGSKLLGWSTDWKATKKNCIVITKKGKSWCLCSLGHSSEAWLLGSWDQIPLRAWMFVSFVYIVLYCIYVCYVGSGLCDNLITH